MPTVLIIDDTPFWRDMTSDALQAKGYTVATACDGLEGLQTFSRGGIDLIILDMEMPRLEGLGFLEQLRRRREGQKIPVIMLTGDMQKQHIIRARQLGAAEYLLKSRFSLEDLLDRVGRQLAASPAGPATPAAAAPQAVKVKADSALQKTVVKSSSAPPAAPQPLLKREQTLRRIEQALEGRTLSGTLSEVISLCTSPKMEMADLTTLISRDSMLSVKVLRAANAAGRKGRGSIISLGDAVKNLGSSAIRDLAATIAVFSALPESEPDGFNPIHCWRHSLAVATLCNQLSAEPDRGVAYLVGLCHDLGEILFRSHFGKEYRQVLEAHRTTGQRVDELTRHMLGLSHGQVVQMILKKLNLPEAIRLPITSFHEAGAARLPGETLARILQLAEYYVNGLLLASSEHSSIRPLSRNECKEVTGQENPPRPDSRELRESVTAMTVAQSRLSAKDEEALMKPMFPAQPIRLWLAREPGLLTFDPIATALESIADVTIAQALPQEKDRGAIQGLVAITRNSTVPGFCAADLSAATSLPDGQTLPVLWLTGRIDKTPDASPEHLKPIVWPVALASIAEFIQKLSQQSPQATAAAA